jgi:hypothetical protein
MVKAGTKTFSWLFDTGAAVTGMNKQYFEMALKTPDQDKSQNHKVVLLPQGKHVICGSI